MNREQAAADLEVAKARIRQGLAAPAKALPSRETLITEALALLDRVQNELRYG